MWNGGVELGLYWIRWDHDFEWQELVQIATSTNQMASDENIWKREKKWIY